MTEPPRIDSEPWEEVQRWSETVFDSRIVTVEAENAVYEDPAFLERFRPLFAEDIGQTPRATFTTGLCFSRSPPGNRTTESVLGIAATYASREFEKSLTADGLIDVERTGSKELQLRGRRQANAFQFDADYPLSGEAVGVADTEPTLQVRVWTGIWATTDSFAMAGGIYPLEDLADAVSRAGGETDIEVGSRPAGDRRGVLGRIRDAAN